MQVLIYENLSQEQKREALKRPVMSVKEEIKDIVENIISEVKQRGDEALVEQALKFDKAQISSVKISNEELNEASKRVDESLKEAIKTACENIKKFHQAQLKESVRVETSKGVWCELLTRPIEKVGLYIPAGSAPLFSTALMLAIPAKIAKCEKIVLASPAKINDTVLFCARLCGVDEVYQMGGAGAIAALAYGSQSVLKVDKIFGPGNAFVTEAKRQVSSDIMGASIDMQAGPSEVLVIADEAANATFVASDLLSQAEHGADSQVILVCLSKEFAKKTQEELTIQLEKLPRKEIALKSLEHSKIFIAKDLNEALEISNAYAPEHLILQTQNPRELLSGVKHAGSVFLGAYSPESMGDYASGTNHVLPTYGLTKTHSSLNLMDFMKTMSVQELSVDGFKNLAKSVELMAEAECLHAHKNAVSLRLEALRNE
ncbi:histidinol dehydrogenase [Campylobacter helveticus]|uniref:Histidinol dehydrogenase n=1 Tax=Campylobacter helveticus TaxID=28898 RepID=A0AAX2UK73_9BACT|nr:histidinol dehydrogenase [Campylobacter helveticus]ARE79906.1 histidinal dehydrogenase / histidinol dehydrogenase [Campylobacter helveticus]MCR2039561.1 histidinol dehydrogenase [Campylobacter helveticus]MCR2054258.1 histidinol dehydrogenase [Campylobacter helveticus]MCR2059680.1 histidinol dehydrogenase [Campylobacter helveticus]MCR2062632.1 histidinol dehydrogenase [Campylobacter helveticus]